MHLVAISHKEEAGITGFFSQCCLATVKLVSARSQRHLGVHHLWIILSSEVFRTGPLKQRESGYFSVGCCPIIQLRIETPYGHYGSVSDLSLHYWAAQTSNQKH